MTTETPDAKYPTSFKDATGDTWTIRLTAPKITAIRQSYDIDLVNLEDPSWLITLSGDVVLWADMLWTLCEVEAVGKDLDIVHFAERIDGDTLDRALTALEGAILLFFPTRQREAIATALAKIDQAFAIQMGRATTAIDRMDVESLIPSSSSTDSPDASASSPPPARSANSPG